MPKLTREQLENIRYVSMSDFCHKIDDIEDINDKRKFATQYLLSYGLSDHNMDYSLSEAIHIAKNKIKESYLNSNNTNNDYIEESENEFFISDPVRYLNGKANAICNEMHNKDTNLIENAVLQAHYIHLAGELNENKAREVEEIDQRANVFDVKFRMEMKYGSKAVFSNIVNDTKIGFFSRLFNTSSQATKNLEKTYKAFNNPEDPLRYGNLNAVKQAGISYIKYKFPNWKEGKPFPTNKEIERLDSATQARMKLSIGLIEASNAQKQLNDSFKDINIAPTNKKEEQLFFENQIKNDLDLEDQIDNDNNKIDYDNVIENNNEMNM